VAVSFHETGHPIHVRITAVTGFSSEAISDWAKRHLRPGSQVISDRLACFRAVTTANSYHKAVITSGKHPNDLPQLRWINTCWATSRPASTAPSMPSTTALRAYGYDQYARRNLAGFCFRFNRRFSMIEMSDRIANAVCCQSVTERDLKVAEACG
jgi:hypothetical protein